jgi:hypothetical protein
MHNTIDFAGGSVPSNDYASFLTETTAVNSIQYVFIAAGIAATIIFGVNATSVSFLNIWTTVATALQ